MANDFFKFKQFTIFQGNCAMKVTTDGCVFGAWLASEIQQVSGAQSALDIGTGTGLLSLMVAQKNRDLCIDAIELDMQAYKQASSNFRGVSFAKNIHAFHGDILTYNTEKKYDVIFSNPPFYENNLASEHVAKNMAHHSSHITLNDLVTKIDSLLSPCGTVFLLYPFQRLEQLKNACEEKGFAFGKCVYVKQSVTHGYFRVMVQMSKTPQLPCNTQYVAITEGGSYTPYVTNLLKEYYLYL